VEHYAGIDVSLEWSSICVVDALGKIVKEAKISSEPATLVAFFEALGFAVKRIGLEAGPLSQWLHAGLKRAGFEAVLLETRRFSVKLPFTIGAGVALRYSITSSAMASTLGGTVMPSSLAVLRLITSSYLVGFCTGRSAGFSPLRMRSNVAGRVPQTRGYRYAVANDRVLLVGTSRIVMGVFADANARRAKHAGFTMSA